MKERDILGAGVKTH